MRLLIMNEESLKPEWDLRVTMLADRDSNNGAGLRLAAGQCAGRPVAAWRLRALVRS